MAEGARRSEAAAPASQGNAPGLGEAFSINLSTGQGMYSFKMPLPEGVAGHTPRVALEYAHGQGHGPFGFGWRLSLRTISRRLDFGSPGDGAADSAGERFLDSGTEIVPIGDGTYRTMVETAFGRYRRAGDAWKIEERNGIVHDLGVTAGARLADPVTPGRLHEWLLERSTDTSGNTIDYRYRLQDSRHYLAEIRYAAYAVRVEYENRPDVRIDARYGFVRKLGLRATRVLVVLDPGPGERVIRSWTLTYSRDAWSGVSMLASVRLTSHGAAANGSPDIVRQPTTFTYAPFAPDVHRVFWMTTEDDGPAPPPLTDVDAALVNMDRAPLPGVLQIVNGRQHYWRNRGDGVWAYPTPVTRAPNVGSFARDGLAFVDMDASGTADLLVAAEHRLQGYYENGGRDGWSRFVPFPRGQRTTPDWTSPSLRLADCDGDGRVDALMSTPRSMVVWRNRGEQGWADPVAVPRTTGTPDLADPSVHLADMTGDGALDLVRVTSGRVEYWPALGNGRFGDPVVMLNSPRLRDVVRDPAAVLLVDMDGDGCADLVHVTSAGIEIFGNQSGAGFGGSVSIPDVPPPIPGTVRPLNLSGRLGSGLTWNSYRGRRIGYVAFDFETATPYVLTRIENGAGLVSDIAYRSAVEDLRRDEAAGELWETNFPFPYLVVAGTTELDTISGRLTDVQFRYHQAHFSAPLRQFQGFRRSERIDRGDTSRPDTLTVSHFLMGQERLPGNGPEHAALNGMLRRTEVFGLDGTPDASKPYRVEESDYALQTLTTLADRRKRVFLFVAASRTQDVERTADSRTEEKTYTYDAVGNVTREGHRAFGTRNGSAQPERIRTSEISYAAGNTRWMLDRVSRIVIRDEANAIVSEVRRYYDGPDFVGLPLHQVDRGCVTREEQLVLSKVEFDAHYAGLNAASLGYVAGTDADGHAAMFAQTSRFAYEARGLKSASRDEVGTLSTYEYDAAGLFRSRLIDSFGTTRFEYDRAIGQVTRVTYADGTETRFACDAQGRVLAVALPGETLANAARRYEYVDTQPCARTARFRFAAGPAGVATVLTYFDGSGKEIQQRVETRGGRFVVSAWQTQNPWGDPGQEFEPTLSNEAGFSVPDAAGRPHRDIFYDARGRTVRTRNYQGGVSTAIYLPFEIITRDANDNDGSPENVARGQFDTPRHELFDVFRYRTEVTDQLGNGNVATTRYRTASGGEVLEISNGTGVVCSNTYDRRGSRLRVDHRDAGVRRLWYDARKLIVRTVDANGNDVIGTLDVRGRLTQLTSNGAVVEQYRYDDPARHALGRIAEVVYAGGRQRFQYNPAGSLITHEHLFDGVAAPHAVTYEYDLLGREIGVRHPDGTHITRTLTPNGWAQAIPGFVENVDYDARGLPVRIAYGNGVTTDITYTAGPGREKTRITRNGNGQILENLTHDLDQLEMLIRSNDAAPGGAGERLFSYDPLYQIASSTAQENGAAVRRHYEYDHHYNLSRFDEAGATMTYDDAARPDRVAGITPKGGARVNVGYDGNGNLLNLPGRILSYDAKNQLTRVVAAGVQADYRYDHEGKRVSKTVDRGAGQIAHTLFVGDLAEIRAGQAAYFVRLGGRRIAIVANGATRFVHDDYLGSTAFFTDAGGTRIAAIGYRPFGNVASSAGTIDFRTFGAHPFDTESGLFYMKKRYYAPELGRFLTPDPIALYQPEKSLGNPKALHPYIYVANDPLNKTDPSGLSFWSVLGGIVGVIVGVLVAVAVIALTVMTAGLFGVFAAVMVGIGLTVAGFGVMAVCYVIASATAGTAFGEFMRGFLIGFNAGMNAALATAIFGPVVGVALGVVNFLAVFDGIAKNSVYQGILGWASWLMPMSWLATAVGLVLFVINVVVAFFTVTIPGWFGGSGWAAARIDSVNIDWGTGTIVMAGGLIQPAGGSSGFNLGNFVFLQSGKGGNAALVRHETGHGLNVAAFGSLFHFVGAFDENWPGNRGQNAFAEELAESHANRPGRPTVPLWG